MADKRTRLIRPSHRPDVDSYRWTIPGDPWWAGPPTPGDPDRMQSTRSQRQWHRAVEIESRMALQAYDLLRAIDRPTRVHLTFRVARHVGIGLIPWHVSAPPVHQLAHDTLDIITGMWMSSADRVFDMHATKGYAPAGERPGCDVFLIVEPDGPLPPVELPTPVNLIVP